MVSIRDDRWRARAPQAVVLALVMLGHAGVGLWLVQARQAEQISFPDASLEVFLLPAERPFATSPPPPFPAAPARPHSVQTALRPKPVPAAAPDPAPHTGTSPKPSETDTARLLDALRAGARREIRSGGVERDFLQHRAEPLPGRSEPFTPNAIVLREGMTPEKLVAMIGALTGGNYRPCPDTISKIRDLSARNERIGDAELMRLLDRERRNGCR